MGSGAPKRQSELSSGIARLELAVRDEGAGHHAIQTRPYAEVATPTKRMPAHVVTVQKTHWCRGRESNPYAPFQESGGFSSHRGFHRQQLAVCALDYAFTVALPR